MRLFSCFFVLCVLAACNPLAKAPEPPAPAGTEEFIEQQQSICEARGGSFGTGPGKSTKVCFITPSDANQPCASKSDCEGLCLARSRTCAPIVPMFGCNEVLLANGRRATVCLD